MSHREAFPLADLRSLAHKDWPYSGTAHEWRGFVKSGKGIAPLPCNDLTELQSLIEWAIDQKKYTVYQKQNFGDLK
jgi:hypothetical protein